MSFKTLQKCNCGSGEIRHALIDARGIFCTYVCSACEPDARERYRADIFEDPNYWADEPIDGDDWD